MLDLFTEKPDPFHPDRLAQWRQAHAAPLDMAPYAEALLALLQEVQSLPTWSRRSLERLAPLGQAVRIKWVGFFGDEFKHL